MVHFRGTNLLNVWAAAKRAELTRPLAAPKASAGTSSNDNRPHPAVAHSLTAGAETSRASEGRRLSALANWIPAQPAGTGGSELNLPGQQRVDSEDWPSQVVHFI